VSAPAHVSVDGQPLALLRGEASGPLAPVSAGRLLAMSRFAWLRRDGSTLLAETSLGPGVIELHDPRALALLYRLMAPTAIDEALAAGAGLPLQTALELCSLLIAGGVVVDAGSVGDAPGTGSVEDEPPLAVWEFHDLLFHARSRPGRHHAPSGGTYRFAGRFPIAPAIPPPRVGSEIALTTPDWERIERSDPPLAAVQGQRQSLRSYGQTPVDIDQIGELLYRVARIVDFWDVPGRGGESERYVVKPYPSGGALYELEFYVVVGACNGLEPGLYHYAGDRHVLEPVASMTPEVSGLLADAASGMGVPAQPMQTVIVLGARMGRTAWKYQSLAYALVLKHVGVVLQTIYLSATAMGLAACAVGTGDADRFARASGVDYYEESSVGEIAIGSRPSVAEGDRGDR
jgi:oxazoline/thiazoline dehydrogenase